MSNRVSCGDTWPSTMHDVVWVANAFHLEYDPDIPDVIAWCAEQGLDANRIPHPDGLVVRLESPDGGLVADVVEVQVTDPAEPLKSTVRDPHGAAIRLPARQVPVTSIPPGGGIVPQWAAHLIATTEEPA